MFPEGCLDIAPVNTTSQRQKQHEGTWDAIRMISAAVLEVSPFVLFRCTGISIDIPLKISL